MSTKKSAKKSKSTKKVTKTTAKSSKAPAKTVATEAHPLKKKYLHKEQEDFFAANPNAKSLIIIFLLLAVAAFIYIIQAQGLLMAMTP